MLLEYSRNPLVCICTNVVCYPSSLYAGHLRIPAEIGIVTGFSAYSLWLLSCLCPGRSQTAWWKMPCTIFGLRLAKIIEHIAQVSEFSRTLYPYFKKKEGKEIRSPDHDFKVSLLCRMLCCGLRMVSGCTSIGTQGARDQKKWKPSVWKYNKQIVFVLTSSS